MLWSWCSCKLLHRVKHSWQTGLTNMQPFPYNKPFCIGTHCHHCFFRKLWPAVICEVTVSFMPDSLQDTVHYARHWKEGFSDMHPHGHISWWVKDIATKFTLNWETLAEIMVLSWQGSWSLRRRPRLHLDLTLQFKGNWRTQYTTNSRFLFSPNPAKSMERLTSLKTCHYFYVIYFTVIFLLE